MFFSWGVTPGEEVALPLQLIEGEINRCPFSDTLSKQAGFPMLSDLKCFTDSGQISIHSAQATWLHIIYSHDYIIIYNTPSGQGEKKASTGSDSTWQSTIKLTLRVHWVGRTYQKYVSDVSVHTLMVDIAADLYAMITISAPISVIQIKKCNKNIDKRVEGCTRSCKEVTWVRPG